MAKMTDEKCIQECLQLINRYPNRTEEDYEDSYEDTLSLLCKTDNYFQSVCVRAAYDRIWRQDVYSLCCLFD